MTTRERRRRPRRLGPGDLSAHPLVAVRRREDDDRASPAWRSGRTSDTRFRAPRASRGEAKQDGVDYHFLTRDEFVERRRLGEFTESAEVHGNLYGTLRREVSRVLAGDGTSSWTSTCRARALIRERFPTAVTVFVLPPSGDVLLDRLRRRNTESPAQLARSITFRSPRTAGGRRVRVCRRERRPRPGCSARVGSIMDAEVVSRERIFGLQRHRRAARSRGSSRK